MWAEEGGGGRYLTTANLAAALACPASFAWDFTEMRVRTESDFRNSLVLLDVILAHFF